MLLEPEWLQEFWLFFFIDGNSCSIRGVLVFRCNCFFAEHHDLSDFDFFDWLWKWVHRRVCFVKSRMDRIYNCFDDFYCEIFAANTNFAIKIWRILFID
jgi:hypothetical protein